MLQPVKHRITPGVRDLFRLSLDQYHEMIRAGVLGEDDPVELLGGVLVSKMSKNAPHRTATHLLRSTLEAGLDPGWYVDSQEPITVGDSEPEPDVVVVRGAPVITPTATRAPVTWHWSCRLRRAASSGIAVGRAAFTRRRAFRSTGS